MKRMTKLTSILLVAILLFMLLPIYTLAANNGPMDPVTYEDYTYDLAWITIYTPNKDDSVKVFSDHKANNKAITGATYDLKSNTLTLKNFKQPTKIIETNVMGENFKIKLVGTNQIAGLNIWGDAWGGSVQFIGSGSIEINKKKTNENAVNMYAETSTAVFKIDKTATVKLWAKTNIVNITMTKVSTGAKAVVFANGQNLTVKKSQAYYEIYKYIAFKFDEDSYGTSYPVYKDSKGTEYVVGDMYNDTPSQIYKIGSKGSDGYYTGTKSSIAFSSLTQVINKTKVKGCYNYVLKGKSLTIPAGSSAATTIKKLTAKKKGFTAKWTKKSVTGYQLQYSTSSKFTSPKTVTVKKAATVSKSISKLKAKKKYYVRIRTYKTVSNQKLYSSWSKAKTVKTKK